MRRFARRALLALLLVVLGVSIFRGPSYARGASLVVRAADLDGWIRRAADAEARAVTVGAATTIPTRHGPIPARVYRPAGRLTRSVVLVPGVHAMGIEEPRLTGLAKDLAASGLGVATIALPGLVRYRFTPDAPDTIEDAAAWLSDQRDLAPDGRVGLMGISFAGGLSVVAAGRPAVRDRIAFVFSFGGHGNLPRVMKYLCSGLEPLPPGAPPDTPPRHRPPHDYGVAVILLGVADRMVPHDQVQPLRDGIETFLHASQLTLVDRRLADETFEEARRLVADLPEPAAELMRLVNERQVAALGAKLLPILERIDVYPPTMSPDQSPAPSAPVYLLHGTDDTVIPAVETRLLAAHLEPRTEVHALLSGLITHAEVDRAPEAHEVWRLVGFWASLLRE